MQQTYSDRPSGPAVAIVGIGGVFPGARDLEQYWDNIVQARNLAREPPPGRWLLALADAYAAGEPRPDRVYSRRACFVEDFAPVTEGLAIDSTFLAGLDPMFQLLLAAGNQAWRAGNTSGIDKTRAGIIIGNIALPTDRASALADELLRPVIERQVLGRSRAVTPVDKLNRYVAGLPAGILARALGLGGGSYTLDAACASSLYAVKYAVDELQAGRADAMLAGGLSRPDSLYTQMGFSALHAISASGRCAPFDHKADGLVVGEGCGMLLLKRLHDACATGDHIYAVIKGIGLSNDIGGNLMSPDSEGQLRAMRTAYRHTGWQPTDVDLIECHGTGTPVGDVVEFNSLVTLWDKQYGDRRCVIGSVKSNIGHLLTAAGSAGLIKVLLALQHSTLPPTANFEHANPDVDLERSPFNVLNAAQPWRRRDAATPRRAAISAFGFGGINAHLLLEEWTELSPADSRPQTPVIASGREDIAIIGMDAAFGPWQSLPEFQRRVGGADHAAQPRTLDKWWGVSNQDEVRGYAIDQVTVPIGRFRIPPQELKEMLPQQLLMLQVAANAIADAGLSTTGGLTEAGVYIGIGLDLNTTNFHVRWSLLDLAREWNELLGLQLSSADLAQWTAALQESCTPPLTANRTMGALGGIVASRIARAFNIGGPSFTLSSEESSGLRAVAAGVRALQRHEITTAVVGAVELASDVRAVCGLTAARSCSVSGVHQPFDRDADGTVITDGAAALILKRLTDAERDGDRIYAVIQGVGAASGGRTEATMPAASAYLSAINQALTDANLDTNAISYIETHGSGIPAEDQLEAASLAQLLQTRDTGLPCALGSVKADIGHAGAAGGLAAMVKTVLCLQRHIQPSLRHLRQPLSELSGTPGRLYAPPQAQYWLRNKCAGPRRALVNALGVDGNCVSAVLAERTGTPDPKQPHWLDETRPLLFTIAADTPGDLLQALKRLSADSLGITATAMPQLASDCHQRQTRSGAKLGLALLAANAAQLNDRIAAARNCISQALASADHNLYYNPQPLGAEAGVAWVFPGSGNHFHGMGREAAACWPEVLDQLDAENDRLADQFAGMKFWSYPVTEEFSHRDLIFGQVWLGTLLGDIVTSFGVRPSAVIGYSLGETAGLFATRAWRDRDLMLRRIENSSLFTDDLAGACLAARQTWGLPETEAVDWLVGVVDCPAPLVLEQLPQRPRVYLLIINTADECVIGGNRASVMALVADLGCHFHPVNGVTTVHCEVVQPVARAYRELHLFDTNPPPGIHYYSGHHARAYELTRDSAADSITGQALRFFDYPKVIDSAYADGVRVFIEMGPGATCTRMISRVLGARPHLARAVCVKGQSEFLLMLRLLGQLHSERIPLDLSRLYPASVPARSIPLHVISVPVGKADLKLPPPPRKTDASIATHQPANAPDAKAVAQVVALSGSTLPDNLLTQMLQQATRTETARTEAQAAFLRVASGVQATLAQALSAQAGLLHTQVDTAGFFPVILDQPAAPGHAPAPGQPRYDSFLCREFAIGSIARVLGDRYAAADTYPTRVRLPDEPLLLVDRILEVAGEPCSMTTGRVVTEHDVLDHAWYLDGGRIPTCIAVEAGQADLFLSAYLGIDLHTRGLARYRLLDAEVTFHGALPRPGQTIRYDIHIDQFFRQGQTYLFRFWFDGTVAGRPLISMRNGCAGFFTQAELDAGQGIVLTSLEQRPLMGRRPADRRELVAMRKESYSDAQIDALREGRLADCFGADFAGLSLRRPAGLPGDRMRLVHRVLGLDPAGGRYGIGMITGEADVHPDDWYLTCHFVDDQVMPGTLMYECCLHTLRIYLLRLGWVGEADHLVYQPITGISSRLKCRGQVTAATRKVQYAITLKEYGYMPEGTPYVIADALMYADGRAIVQMSDMSLLLSGLDKDTLTVLWGQRAVPPPRQVLFDYASILAFATGKPSVAFGERYRVFDRERVIARLPGPPYQFLDRIVGIRNCKQWLLQAGGEIVAEYDVPTDAWYFDADRQPHVPFAVLLETALQPCGWLAAYLGSALTSEQDLSFRNLGGQASQYQPVTPAAGTITTTVRITNVSSSGGMIIQHFDYSLHNQRGLVYHGNTYFGFFTRAALSNQIGIREAHLYQPGPEELARGQVCPYPDRPPYSRRMLRMVDAITLFDPQGGPHGLGFISGTATVDPDAWFFKAHFYQDPVWPGSLGLESLLQLLKVVAYTRWGQDREQVVFESQAAGQMHNWVYRGQILPTDRQVTVQAIITACDDREKMLRADGFLGVDGRIIYQMLGFTLKLMDNHAL